MPETLEIGGEIIGLNQTKTLELKVAKLFDYTEMSIPVQVIRGKKDGPVLFLSAAVHGDEINGVEIIKRLINRKKIIKSIIGTLICVPVVNVYGFNNNTRYLPDRRDLNRCFPGNSNGSLGSQIAAIFMKEIVAKATHGIDFHTGALHRKNLPQIRAFLDDDATKKLAYQFGNPLIINSKIRDGSLREAAQELGIPCLLFEGGEALRYDENVIRAGIKGALNVMTAIGMLPDKATQKTNLKTKAFVANSSYWVRAPHSGSMRSRKNLGAYVKENEVVGEISDPYGERKQTVRVGKEGVIIGMTQLPLLNRGDAYMHIATFNNSEAVEGHIEAYNDEISNIP